MVILLDLFSPPFAADVGIDHAEIKSIGLTYRPGLRQSRIF
jgi:hypothetical protein